MKPVLCYFFLSLLSLHSCKEHKQNQESVKSKTSEVSAQLSSLLAKTKLDGVILISDVQNEVYYSNDFEQAKTKLLPASTFKIPNSIIGLEIGILTNASTVFKWNGSQRRFPMWEKDLTLKEAFQTSCVPCYQELAIKIGVENMSSYLAQLNYPGMKFNQENLDMFWLVGESEISPFQQIDFLERMYNAELDISSSTIDVMKNILLIEENSNYAISGKTGWGVIEDTDIGWIVGYLEQGDHLYFFATAITPQFDFDMDNFVAVRKDITLKAFEKLGVL